MIIFSPVTVVVLGVIFLTPVPSLSCLSTNDPGWLVPRGLIYRRPGEDLTLWCIANFTHEKLKSGAYGPESLFFTRSNSDPLPKTIVNETVVETIVRNLTYEDAGRYMCRINTTGGSNSTLCSTHLYVGFDDPPVEDFRCISNALKTLDCSWTVSPVVKNVTIEYRSFNDSRVSLYNCTEHKRNRSEPNRVNCTFKGANYNRSSKNLYFFIRATSLLPGANEIPLLTTKFEHFKNVRPLPPGEVAALEVGRRNATIAWNITAEVKDLVDENGLVHEITYQSNFTPEPVVIFVNTTRENCPDLTVRHTLENLDHPYANYSVKIRSICGEAEYEEDLWSDYSKPLQFQTMPDAPSDVPFVPDGAYYFDSDEALVVYWDAVAEVSRNGPNFRYVVDYTDSHISATKEANSETFVMKLNGTWRDRAVNFSISAVNDEGMKAGKIIEVPASSSSLSIAEVTVIKQEKSGHFLISWTPPDDLERVLMYTIFYCEIKPPDEHNQRCKTRPGRITVDATATSVELSLPEDKFYMFAVNILFQVNKTGKSEVEASPLRWDIDLDDVEYALPVGLIVGGTVIVICVSLAYPTFEGAKRKVKAWTKFPPIIVPKIDHEGVGGANTPHGLEGGPIIGEELGDNLMRQLPATPVSSRLTEQVSMQMRDGSVPGISTLASDDDDYYTIVDISPNDQKNSSDGSQSACVDDEDRGSFVEAPSVLGRKGSSDSVQSTEMEQVPGYVVSGEFSAATNPASVELVPGTSPGLAHRSVDTDVGIDEQEGGGRVTILAPDYCLYSQLPQDGAILYPSNVTFTVDVNVTSMGRATTSQGPSNSCEGDPGYVTAMALAEPPPPPPTAPVGPSGYVKAL